MSEDLFDEEYDPLAPMMGGPVPDLADEPLAHGEIAGGNGVVRLLAEDERIRAVRVHPQWFDRLPAGQTLQQAFEEAFLVAGMRSAEPGETPDVGEPRFELPEFSERAIDAYAALLHDHAEHWRRVAAQEVTAPTGPVARGEHLGVRIELGRNGHPERIRLDEDWLDGVQVGVICSSVESALQRAYAAFVPADDDRQAALDALRREHAVLQAGFRTLINSVRRGT